MKRLTRSGLCLTACGVVAQGGCVTFWQNEIEALLAPSSPDNALAILNSVFLQLLGPLIY